MLGDIPTFRISDTHSLSLLFPSLISSGSRTFLYSYLGEARNKSEAINRNSFIHVYQLSLVFWQSVLLFVTDKEKALFLVIILLSCIGKSIGEIFQGQKLYFSLASTECQPGSLEGIKGLHQSPSGFLPCPQLSPFPFFPSTGNFLDAYNPSSPLESLSNCQLNYGKSIEIFQSPKKMHISGAISLKILHISNGSEEILYVFFKVGIL